MTKEYFKRFFLIEPNLKKSYGHVVEFPFALHNYLKRTGKQVYIVCNKDVDEKLFRSSDNLVPFISHGCFEDLTNGGASFAKDLSCLDKKFHFTNKDLIIILTGYTNQTYGIAKFLQNIVHNKQPRFCIWFHQLYPPTKDFNQTLKSEFREQIYEDLQESFKAINNLDNVYIFTTVSKKLREIYSNLSSRRVGFLPLPYSYALLDGKRPDNQQFTIGFLGDGRYEKSLQAILKYITDYEDRENYFILQSIFPRGYTKKKLDNLNRLETKINKEYTNVSFVKIPLSNSRYKTLMGKLGAVILPYHPRSYDNRISGIFIEAVINGKPVIVSENTWMAEQVKLLDNGVAFEYESGTAGLNNAILKLKSRYQYFLEKASKASRQYKEIHSSGNFIKSLLDFVS